MARRGQADNDRVRAGRGSGAIRTVAFVVNGDERSAMADRARAFAVRIQGEWRVKVAYRLGGRFGSVTDFSAWLTQASPDIVYVFDMSLAGVLAASWHRWRTRTPLVIDTGDAITALARSLRAPAGVAATAMLEKLSLAVADRIVVRGSFHKELLARDGINATVIPDGVDLGQFTPRDGGSVRASLGIGDELTIGVLGSSVWSPTLQMAYGWDLVEMLKLLAGERVRGLLVGDGSGVPRLQQRARELGVEQQIIFAGRRAMDELPELLAASNVWLSTQTNDVPGNVRTTGKLPLYLAAGRYVLATNVGEARYVLPADMLVPYEGTVDRTYPMRLAERVRTLLRDRTKLQLGAQGPAIAREHFDYDLLARRVSAVLESVSRPGAGHR